MNDLNNILLEYNNNQRLYNINIGRIISLIEHSNNNQNNNQNNISQEYNNNQRLYNLNIGRTINLIEHNNNNNQTTAAATSTTRNRYYTSNRLSNAIQEQILFFLNSAATDTTAVTRSNPTQEQLQYATENIEYSTDLVHTICPISLEAFQIGEPITRIRHCGHIFRRDCLQRWFSNHIVCPVCRHDITAASSTATAAPLQQPQRTYSNNRTSSSSSILSQLLQSLMDLSGSSTDYTTPYNRNTSNLLYEITIPLFQGSYTDDSYSEPETYNSNNDFTSPSRRRAAAQNFENGSNAEEDDDTDVITIGNITVD